ncbi:MULTISPECIES: BlaI/MecI/CopY family transcriptional regulator [Enterococcus]|jgi:predicted transcriptional regulator|uniref:BlaI/MecI/CopY family transcriptional regulator n=1 Tax=Enterococcus entomosocium TaxID=3034352 RepID=A0ABV3MH14_9ENTE|nr:MULTISPECIES: BlaI/MecI/CopY family transcriptional regulator [Enterococcus]MBK0038824.1 BlaI/MecI/CopY family transcriptional regulator [Enterococcus sp. S52]MBK0071898.1 BlaI/MecI/CopY family transcriptional regulator [Enterococcus sp. S53]MBK0142102.1 BlaI/MecI/CopY family transcriptional regulator [Enterococcus sp. S76]MBK0145755.1 BlaI/MecI/CopY family transcriptional regulator [Enterococcus sp. S77]MCO5496769.1 BlaI/MecI/CopY family transcriptional regulator [Enterococcus innesii]
MELTKIEYQIMLAFYEQNKQLTKVLLLEKYPDFKVNTLYLMIDRLVNKNYLEVFIDQSITKEYLYRAKYSASEFFSQLIGQSAVHDLVEQTIKKSSNTIYLGFLLKLIQTSKNNL